VTIGVSPDVNEKRETFFRFLFGQSSGYVCLAFGSTSGKERFKEQFYQYPEQMPELLDAINKGYLGQNVWFCPQLLERGGRRKEYIGSTPVIWADLDACNPDLMKVRPSMVVESSPGRWQGYWRVEDAEPSEAEDIARRIAYFHAEDGADRSGWDLTQLLRVPLTYNYKYDTDNGVPEVLVTNVHRSLYRMEDFAVYPQAAGYQYLETPFPTELPKESAEEILQANRFKLNPLVWQLFQVEPSDDWSSALWQLQLSLFETGLSREQVLVVVREAKCNKYKRDGKAEKLLWKEVCRAFARYEEQSNVMIPKDFVEEPLLSDEERKSVDAEDTFIERYTAWARSLGDAAPQYHQAGAFVALSSLLSGSLRLPTSYGTIIPNLWFMILADTTLTRKTTAMDIAMDLIMEIDTDAILATDGSIEGLLGQLSTRPGRPSIFLRDEFSGLLEMITKRDYYAGMPELFTKMYDGKMQKRVLRKETIEVRDPILIIFAGGIKNKITGLLNLEHVSSGFMPRFIFITAESDIARLRPLGPPTDVDIGNREAIKAELSDLVAHYNTQSTLTVKSTKVAVTTPTHWNAILTADAWERYNKLESGMLQAGLNSDKPEIMTPMYDRLSKSILKASILISASARRTDKLIVEERDIVRAIRYGETWRMYAKEVLNNIGRGDAERQLETIHRAIIKKDGVTRSQLMQSYHLNARDADMIFQTLEQRGQITRSKSGRTEILYPATRKVKV